MSFAKRKLCQQTTCLLRGSCLCRPTSSFFSGNKPSLQDLTCGPDGCNSPITVEAWNGAPGASGSTGTAVGLDLCDKLVFWSDSLDISVTQGSAIVNLEIPGSTGGVSPDFWRDSMGNPPNGIGDQTKMIFHQNDLSIGVNGDMTVGNRGNDTDTVVGRDAMTTGASGSRVAVGYRAGQFGQATSAIAIGKDAGNTNQGRFGISIGVESGFSGQGVASVAIGQVAGRISQGEGAVAVGPAAGQTNQVKGAVAVGLAAGQTNQGEESVAIGQLAGNIGQGEGSVALGGVAGQINQGTAAVAVGPSAGTNTQGKSSVRGL